MVELRNYSNLLAIRTLTFDKNGVCNYKLIGGGGGAGGYDANTPGGNGAQAQIIEGQIDVKAGDVLYVFLGLGGEGGGSNSTGGGGASGGIGAFYNTTGGRGGNAGGGGSSGGGGGGGGASIIYKLANGVTTPLVVAGGGGGGGGAGLYSGGLNAEYNPTAPIESRLLQYPVGPTDGAWVPVLNNYSVTSGFSNTFEYEVYFPEIYTEYTFNVAADDVGTLSLDGEVLASNFAFGSTTVIRKYVDRGWHTVKYTYADTGGYPYAVGGNIVTSFNQKEIFNTRMPYNLNTGTQFLSNGGRGQDKDGDGGGGGGGGGGRCGGAGGRSIAGDDGGAAGSSGYAYANESLGARITGYSNIASTEASSGAGAGGISSGAIKGQGGYFAVSCSQNDIKVYNSVGGFLGKYLSGYSNVNNVYVRRSDAGGYWAESKEVYVRQNGQWVRVFGSFDPTVEIT